MADVVTTDDWRETLKAALAAYEHTESSWLRETRPLPPPDLVRRVNAADKADPRRFLTSGAADLFAILDALIDLTRDRAQTRPVLPPRPAVMELGCGVGRLLRHVPRAAVARLVATDVNADCLAWCRASFPDVECHHHGPRPPIATLDAASFDLIYANSVFTHIPLERQADWLNEVARLLKPGGCLVATVLGHTHRELLLDAAQRDALDTDGALQIHPETGGDPAGPAIAYGAVFQIRERLHADFGAVLDVCGIRERPGSQDVLVARRPGPQ
jgi:SAM-dependent methyltransferase